MFTLHNGDCLDYLPSIQSKSVRLIVTDPPYGIKFNKGYKENVLPITGDDGFSVMVFMDDMLREWQRILMDDGAIYVFTRFDVMPYWWLKLKNYFDMKNCIVWNKGGGSPGDLEGNYAFTHEMVLFGSTSQHKLNGKRIGNVWDFPRERIEFHETQKLTTIISRMIEKSSNVGDLVFDPFMGSGTTGVSAIQNGRRFIGIEINKGYCEIAEKRLSEAVLSHKFLTPSNNRLHWTGGDSPALPSQSTLEGFTDPEADTTPPASQ